MNKSVLIVIVLLLLGGGVWYFSRPKPQTEEFSGTLMQAMKLNVPMKCTWKSNEGSGESFVKGEDMQLKTMMGGRTGHMVKKAGCVWTWDDSQKQGVKFCQEQLVEASSEPSAGTPDAGSFKAEGVDWNMEYNCRPDMFGGERFELPADVNFTDMGQMMRQFAPR